MSLLNNGNRLLWANDAGINKLLYGQQPTPIECLLGVRPHLTIVNFSGSMSFVEVISGNTTQDHSTVFNMTSTEWGFGDGFYQSIPPTGGNSAGINSITNNSNQAPNPMGSSNLTLLFRSHIGTGLSGSSLEPSPSFSGNWSANLSSQQFSSIIPRSIEANLRLVCPNISNPDGFLLQLQNVSFATFATGINSGQVTNSIVDIQGITIFPATGLTNLDQSTALVSAEKHFSFVFPTLGHTTFTASIVYTYNLLVQGFRDQTFTTNVNINITNLSTSNFYESPFIPFGT